MGTKRLFEFPVNTSPSGSFIIYMGDSGAGFTEVQVTVDDFFTGYSPALASIAGLTTAANELIYTTASNVYATTPLTAFSRGLLGDSGVSAWQTDLGLLVGTDVEAWSAALDSIAALTTSADEMIYTTGSNVYTTTSLTSLARSLLADTTTSAMQSTLGLGSAATHAATDFLLVANNLSDLNSASTARTNLGLGSAATHAATDFLLVANNLSDLNSASTARTNLGLGTMATQSASAYLALTGGTMAGAINMGSNQINSLADPSSAQDAATKAYVDSVASGLNILPAVYAATTATLNATYLNGASGVGATLVNAGTLAAFSIDSVSPPLNSTVLIKNQSSSLQNGIYKVTTVGSGAVAWVLTRATYYDDPSEINPGDFVLVDFGTTNTGTGWIETATVTSVGVDAISFSLFGAGIYAQKGANSDITSMSGLNGYLQAPLGIKDASGNIVLHFSSVASAVNYIDIINGAASGAINPVITMTGSSTNISLSFQPKGDAAFQILGTSSRGGTFNLYENTANGTDYIQLKAPESIALTYSLTLPAADATNAGIWSNGSGILSLGTYANSNITSMTGLTGYLQAPAGVKDSNGNIVNVFTGVSNAVNYLGLQNSPTGMPVSLYTTGTDSTVPLQFGVKGGVAWIYDTAATVSGSLRLYNGAAGHYTALTVATAQSTDLTLKLPAADGTAGQFIKTDASGQLAFSSTLPASAILQTPASGTLTNCTGYTIANLSDVAWTSWTPGWTGFSAAPTGVAAYYKLIGKTCFCRIDIGGNGTSNATTLTITGLPATANANNYQYISVPFAYNNSSRVTNASGYITASGTTLTCELGGSATGWTNTGGKSVALSFFYETT